MHEPLLEVAFAVPNGGALSALGLPDVLVPLVLAITIALAVRFRPSGAARPPAHRVELIVGTIAVLLVPALVTFLVEWNANVLTGATLEAFRASRPIVPLAVLLLVLLAFIAGARRPHRHAPVAPTEARRWNSFLPSGSALLPVASSALVLVLGVGTVFEHRLPSEALVTIPSGTTIISSSTDPVWGVGAVRGVSAFDVPYSLVAFLLLLGVLVSVGIFLARDARAPVANGREAAADRSSRRHRARQALLLASGGVVLALTAALVELTGLVGFAANITDLAAAGGPRVGNRAPIDGVDIIRFVLALAGTASAGTLLVRAVVPEEPVVIARGVEAATRTPGAA